MLGCKFTLNLPGLTKSFSSQQELDDFIHNNYERVQAALKNTNVIYSKEFSSKDEVYSKLRAMKLEGGVSTIYELGGVKVEVIDSKIKPGYTGVTRKINTLQRGDHLLFTPFNESNYKSYKADMLEEEYLRQDPSLTKMQARDKANREVEKIVATWPIMAQMGTDIHRIASIFFDNNLTNVQALWDSYTASLDGAKSPLSRAAVQELYDVLDSIRKEAIRVTGDPDVKFITEVPVYDENTKTVGVIDFVAVGQDGSVYIGDFKTSYKQVSEWDKDKTTRYQYQMAFYRQLLSVQGINTKDAWVVPVILSSSDTANKVVEAIEVDQIERLGLQLDTTLSEVSYRAKQEIPAKEVQLKFKTSGVINDETNKFFDITAEEDIKSQYEQFMKSNVIYNHGKPYFKDGSGKVQLEPWITTPRTEEEIQQNKLAEAKNFNTIVSFLNKRMNSKATKAENFKTQFKGMISNVNGISEEDRYYNPFGSAYEADVDKLRTANKAVKRYIDGNWDIYDLPELEEHGIITFKHKHTSIVEFLIISDEDLNTRINLKYGTSLLGNFFNDVSTVKNNYNLPNQKKYFDGIKVLSFINDNADLFSDKNLSLHMIRAINYDSSQIEVLSFDRLKANYEQLAKAANVKYNLNKVKTASSAETLSAAIMSISEDEASRSSNVRKLLKNLNITLGNEYPDNISLRNKLVELRESFRVSLGYDDTNLDFVDNKLAQVYGFLNSYIAELAGVDTKYNVEARGDMKKFSMYNSTLFSSFHELQNEVAKTALLPVRIAMDQMAHSYREFNNEFRPIFKEFYDAKNVSTIIGNHYYAFTNLFEKDAKGNIDKTFRFKNPDDNLGDVNYLDESERKFLRKVLPVIADKLYGPIGSENMKVTGDYFNVPLLRASGTSRVMDKGVSGIGKGLMNSIRNSTEAVIEEYSIFPEQEEESMKASREMQSMYDKYNISKDPGTRANFIASKDMIDFEKNVEYILADLVYTSMKIEAYNGALPMVSAVITNSMLYEMGFSNKELGNTYDYIRDNIKMSVFQERNIEPHQKETYKALASVKHAVSMLQLGLAPLNLVREVLQGQWANISKLVTGRYGEDGPTFTDWTWAISRIIGESGDFVKIVTLTEELNHEYRLANMDTHQLAEKMAIAKTGFTQFSSRWFLWAMGAPDYINRMAFLLAKMHKDGSYEAHTMEGEVMKYDWKKDKRFSIYAGGDKSHPDYYKQRNLYLLHLDEFNKGSAMTGYVKEFLKEGDDLPRAYTNTERESIKAFVNYLHGPYDHEDKIGLQNTLFGVMFMQFKTWMLSKKMQYFMSPDTYRVGRYVHRYADGAFWYRDKNGEPTTEVTDDPIMEWKGKFMEGIWNSLVRTVTIVRSNGLDFNKTFNDIKSDGEIPSNLALMVMDLSLWFLFAVAIKGIIDWDELEENNRLAYGLANSVMDATADLNILKNIQQVTDPSSMIPAFGYVYDNVNTLLEAMAGEANYKNLLVNATAATRSIRDVTYLLDD